MQFEGIYTPLVTPYHADFSLNEEALAETVELLIGALALDLTLQHWDLSRDRLERFVRPDPLPVDVLSLKDSRNAV